MASATLARVPPSAGPLGPLFGALDTYGGAKPNLSPYDPRHIVYPYWPGQPVFSNWNTEKGIREGYHANPIVYAAMSRITSLGSSVPWVAMERDSSRDDWEPGGSADAQQLETLLEYPNDKISRQQLVCRVLLYLMCSGNGLIGKFWDNPERRKQVVELWPESPVHIQPVPDIFEYISGYLYWDGANRKVWDARDMIHPRLEDPANPYWGISPLKAIARIVDFDNAATAANLAMSQNLAVPTGILIDKGITDPGTLAERRADIANNYGGPANARLPWVLGGEVDWKAMGLSPREMDWMASRGFTRDEISLAFHIDPAMFSREAKTYANSELAHRALWHFAVVPLMDVLRDALNLALVPRERRATLWLTYDLTGVTALRDDIGKKLTALKDAVQSFVPPNTAFALLDLPVGDVPGGDKSYRNVTFVENVDPDLSGQRTDPGAPALPPGFEQDPNADPAASKPPAQQPAKKKRSPWRFRI